MIIVKRKRSVSSSFQIPAGGYILWSGQSANVPPGYVVDAAAGGYFVKGGYVADDTPLGSASHSHTYPGETGLAGQHSHTGNLSLSGADSTGIYTPGNTSDTYAKGGHGHGGTHTTTADGEHSHALSATDNASAVPPYVYYHWIRATEDADIPVGGIVMFSGSTSEIPAGFALCDGQNGRPDMRDKFVRGAVDDASVGTNGGTAAHSHTNPQTAIAGSHTHGAAFDSSWPGEKGNDAWAQTAGGSIASSIHRHHVTYTTASNAGHAHGVPNTDLTSHVPEYLKLFFIVRVV